ncbi:hypothetical protein ASF26_04175 [Methylobacterium sp. Leaf93]|nr:hypothetical protein ASF26_04175 [Methylobacterium sp. Leaf93]
MRSEYFLTSAEPRAHIPSPRAWGEGRDDLVVGAARRQPGVRGLVRVNLLRTGPLTLAPLITSTTRCL